MDITENNVENCSDGVENDLNLINTRVQRKPKILDSEDEDSTPIDSKETHENDANSDENLPQIVENRKTKHLAIIDSDSEDESTNSSNQNDERDSTLIDSKETHKTDANSDENLPEIEENRKTKRLAIIDSDSEDESTNSNNQIDETDLKGKNTIGRDKGEEALSEDDEALAEDDEALAEDDVSPHNKSFPDEETAIVTVINTQNNTEIVENVIKSTSLSVLCDPESDEEQGNIVEASFDGVVQPKIYKRQRKKKNEEKPKRMTAQEAAKQRNEIRSESQRMVRELDISLPYHKPKSYTIKEFLEKRSKLASTLPHLPKAPPSVAIKMSKDQLREVSKKLDERIKEVEEFYKSESDDEDDDPSEEIKSWIFCLVDQAVTDAEAKNVTETVDEVVDDKMETENDEENESLKKPNLTELIKDKLSVQPKLNGTCDDIIDLEEGVTKVSGVKQLVQKFLQHTSKRHSHKNKVHINILEVVSTGKIIEETVSMNVDDEEEPAIVETPGAKLKRLKEELQVQMAEKRLEIWKQKHEQGDTLTVEKKIEENSTEKDILDDDEEEEYELTETESEEEEEEYEEQEYKDREKPKSVFLDDEADDEDEGMDVDGDIEDNDSEEAEEPVEPKSPQKKILRRIIKPFSEDSDDDEDDQPSESVKKLEVQKYSEDDDFLPPNLPKEGESQPTQIEENKSEFEFLTPVTYLTGIKNLNTSAKFSKSPTSPQILTNPFGSQDSDFESQSSETQKDTVTANLDTQSTQENLEELAQLCSGEFPETQKETDLPTTQDLLNVCSGDFPSLDNYEKPNLPIPTEIKNLDEEQDQIISQLLDEEDLERFKKKFESPLNASMRKTQIMEADEVNATGLIDSDDENELEIKLKKRKKLVFSDDEEEETVDNEDDEEEEDEPEVEEEIDLQATDDEEQQLENEIKAQESRGYKLTDFLDKEAELSESEWGSADEDERGLDELEIELGDQEKFNEKKIRTELERIHMRQILDEDNREVKLLQELLLEDGELNGTGRKRQFRWRALDSAGSGDFEKRDDDDIYLDEEENEEQLRKMRHKREMFLKKINTNDLEDESSDSQLFQLGEQIVKTKLITSQSSTPVDKPVEVTKAPFSLLSKRGSFLTRKDQVLQRLAEYNKVCDSTGSTVVKNSKSFVFQTVGPAGPLIKDTNKRKASESTPNVIKKLRLDNFSPVIGKTNAKSSRAKKLF